MIHRIKRTMSGINSFFNKMADAPIEVSIPLNNHDNNIARDAERYRMHKEFINKRS